MVNRIGVAMKKVLAGMILLPLAVMAEVVWTPSANSVSDWFNWESSGTAQYQKTEQQMQILLSVKAGKNQSAGVGFNWLAEGAKKTLSGSGLCLTYRASDAFRLDLSQTSITDSDFWGIKVPAAETYTSLYIPFSDLSQEGWGKTVAWSLANHKGVQFSYKGNYATETDSSTTIDILQIGLGDVCDESNIPASGTTVTSTEAFWNSATTVPSSPVNTLGGSFQTYVTGSSTIDKSLADNLAASGAIGFSATLAGDSYPTAGMTMAWNSAGAIANISSESGLCVAYRSTASIRLQVLQEGLAWNNGNYYGYDLPLQESYSVVEIPFANLSQEPYWGYKAVLDLERSLGLQFELKGEAGKTGSIDILQIGFAGNCELPKFAPELQPSFEASETVTLYEGDTLKIPLYSMFKDRDDDSLNISYSVEQESILLVDTVINDTLRLVPKMNTSGEAVLSVIAIDKDSQMALYSNTITVVDKQNVPTVVADSYEVLEDSVLVVSAENGILKNDFDLDGDSFTLNSNTNPANGTLVLEEDGSFTYTPNPNFAGIDSWTYTLKDLGGVSAEGTVSILVKQVNDKPTVTGAITNPAAVEEDFELKMVYVSKSEVVFSDIETPAEDLTYGVSTNGLIKASLSQNNTQFIIALLPEPNKNGTALVTLYAKDSAGDSVGVSFEIEINPMPDPPIANNDSYEALEDSTLTVDVANGVLANDENPDGESILFVDLVDSTENGSLVLNTDGSFTYSPLADYVGSDSFTYVVINALNDTSNVATVTIPVLDRNDGPIVVVDSDTLGTTVKEDYSGTLKYTKAQIKSWFEDPENDPLYYSAENPDGKLSISWTSGGYMNIKVVKDSCGEALVNVIATDSIEGTKPAILSFVIDITPVNDLPKVVSRDTIIVEPSGWIKEIALDSVFLDVDGDSLTYVLETFNNALSVELEGALLTIRPKNESVELAAGVYRVKVGAVDAVDTTFTTIIVDVGGTTGFEKSIVNLQKSWKHSLQNAKGVVKLLDLNGRVLFSKNAPVFESEISNMIDNSSKPMILKTNLGVWKLAPKF